MTRFASICRMFPALLLVAQGVLTAPAAAQSACTSCASPPGCLVCQGQEYRLVYQTVYEQHQETAYRIEYETVYNQHQETRYRPVWETQTRECRYTVARPVVETAVREEHHTVCRPVYETHMRDCSYNVVRYVQRNGQREERYVVNRPVIETAMRDECCTVMRPVVQTVYRTDYHTVYQPVTTCQTELVDQGCYMDQTIVKPSWPYSKLTWQPAGCEVDPATGATVYRRAGLYWTPTNTAPTR